MSKRQEGGEVKKAVEDLIAVMETEITMKEEDLEKTINLLTAQLDTRRKELNQLRQQLHLMEQKWR